MTTAIEKELAQCDQPDDMFYGQTIFSFADMRLAAACMAFVRDMNKNIEALSKHRPLPIPVVVYDSLDDNLRALAARIKEREE